MINRTLRCPENAGHPTVILSTSWWLERQELLKIAGEVTQVLKIARQSTQVLKIAREATPKCSGLVGRLP